MVVKSGKLGWILILTLMTAMYTTKNCTAMYSPVVKRRPPYLFHPLSVWHSVDEQGLIYQKVKAIQGNTMLSLSANTSVV